MSALIARPAATRPRHRAEAAAPPSPRGLRYDLLAVAFLAALTVVYFFPLLTGHTNSITGPYAKYMYPWSAVPNDYDEVGPQTDYAELSYPWNVITDDALAQGTVPLWTANAYGGGYDLYANGSSAVLYPPRLAALAATTPGRAHDLFLVLHLWGSGVAMFVLARQLSLGRWAATFSAVAWMFATWNTGWMQLEVVTPMAVFVPATIAAVHRAMTSRSARSILVAGIVCATAALAGHILFLGLALFVAALYATALTVSGLYRARRAEPGEAHTPRHLRRSAVLELGAAVGRLGLLGLVAGGLAAVLLVPTALALRLGQRLPLTYAELTEQFLAEPRMLLRLVLPPEQPITADRMQYLGFVGTASVPFAVVGLVSRRRPGAWLARSLVVIVPLIMVGTPLTWLAWRVVPGMNVFRPYARLVLFAAFGLALAAGIGVQVLVDALRRHRPAWQAGRPLLAGRVAMAALTLATAAQLIVIGRQINPPFVPNEARYLMPSTPLVEQLRAGANPNGWPSRTIPLVLRGKDETLIGRIFYANTAQTVGLDAMSGYDSNVDRRTLVLLRVLGGADVADPTLDSWPGAYVANFESWTTRYGLLARLGITDIATVPVAPEREIAWDPSWEQLGAEATYRSNDGIVYRVPGAVAGPYLVGADAVVAGEQQALELFTDDAFAADRTLVVEQSELERTGLFPLGPAAVADTVPAGTVSRAERGVNTVSVELSANRPSWLVVPDAWAQGWRATVNGEPVELVRANYAQRAVRVDAGTSIVEMRYRPQGLVAGAAITAVTAALTALGLVWLSASAWLARRRSARRRLELEDELVAEQAGKRRDAQLVDAGDHPAPKA